MVYVTWIQRNTFVLLGLLGIMYIGGFNYHYNLVRWVPNTKLRVLNDEKD